MQFTKACIQPLHLRALLTWVVVLLAVSCFCDSVSWYALLNVFQQQFFRSSYLGVSSLS
jgi:hypothetical protein